MSREQLQDRVGLSPADQQYLGWMLRTPPARMLLLPCLGGAGNVAFGMILVGLGWSAEVNGMLAGGLMAIVGGLAATMLYARCVAICSAVRDAVAAFEVEGTLAGSAAERLARVPRAEPKLVAGIVVSVLVLMVLIGLLLVRELFDAILAVAFALGFGLVPIGVATIFVVRADRVVAAFQGAAGRPDLSRD